MTFGIERRTKIVATVGPASDDPLVMRDMLEAGTDVVRLGLAHGTVESSLERLARVRKAAAQVHRPVGVLIDLPGPKVRTAPFPEDGAILPTGATVHLVEAEHGSASTAKVVEIALEGAVGHLAPGDRLGLGDGGVTLVVTEVGDGDVRAHVENGGILRGRPGIALPDDRMPLHSPTDADLTMLEQLVKADIDAVAVSFVRSAADVAAVRAAVGRDGPMIVAKIETAPAVADLDAIVAAADGVMVARGDLGVELPPEIVPIMQKRILKQASYWGRFAITATQMLESMTANSRPTRAEASDVANAIFDGSDAVMLSAETASGAYPVESVEMMSRIVVAAEQNPQLHVHSERDPFHDSLETDEFTDALAGATNYTAEQIDARYIVVFTQSGFTARLMSKFRPQAPIIALTSREAIARRMNILWGVMPWVLESPGEFHEQIVDRAEELLVRHGMVETGDRIVILMGSPLYERARTNVLRVHRVGG